MRGELYLEAHLQRLRVEKPETAQRRAMAVRGGTAFGEAADNR
jgi:hypothetical protein